MSGTDNNPSIDVLRFSKSNLDVRAWENSYESNPLPFVLLEARHTGSIVNNFRVIYSNHAFDTTIGNKYDFSVHADFLLLYDCAINGNSTEFVVKTSSKKVCLMQIFPAIYGRVAGIITQVQDITDSDFLKKLADTNERLASAAAAARLNAQRFRTVSSTVLDVLVDLDFERNKFEPLIAKSNNFLVPAQKTIEAVKLFYSPLIFPDDIQALRNVMNSVTNDDDIKKIELRAKLFSDSNDYKWFSVTVSAIKYGDVLTHMLFALSDIDIKHKEAEMMKQLAEHDPLSGLLNKSAMTEKSAMMLMNSSDDDMFAFLIVDIDDFKAFNDGFGHLAGDGVISDVSRILKSAFFRGDLIGRVGGDEFVVLMRLENGEKDVAEKFSTIARKLSVTAKERGYSGINISMGATLSNESNKKNYHIMFNEADIALYQAKNEGKNRCVIYNRSIQDRNL